MLDQVPKRQGGLGDAQGAPFCGGARKEAGQRFMKPGITQVRGTSYNGEHKTVKQSG